MNIFFKFQFFLLFRMIRDNYFEFKYSIAFDKASVLSLMSPNAML